MEIKQLRSFIAVVECGNFTKAAERTFTSQPTISTHIKALEDELGVSLIARDTKNIEITDKGRELYDCAVNILELESRLMKRFSDESSNVAHLGVSTIPSTYILPGILKGYSKNTPDVRFVISQGDSSSVIEGLGSGLYDLGLVGMECGSDTLKCDPICRDRMVLIAPPTPEFEELKRQETPDFARLFEHPVIFREPGSGSQRSAENIIRSLGIDPLELNVTARINDQETIKNLVEAGLGISIVSQLSVNEELAAGKLTGFDLPGHESERTFYLACAKSAVKNEAVRSFIRYVKKNYGYGSGDAGMLSGAGSPV